MRCASFGAERLVVIQMCRCVVVVVQVATAAATSL
jgi:hypothetical protein